MKEKYQNVERVRIYFRKEELTKTSSPQRDHDRQLIIDGKIQYILGNGHEIFSDRNNKQQTLSFVPIKPRGLGEQLISEKEYNQIY